jgi:hypothetical protein
MSSKYIAIFIALIALGLSAALAQHPQAVTATCSSSTRGSPTCPNYTAPAATAVPSTSMDGSMNVAAQTSTTLFKGAVPPNAFMVRAYVVFGNGEFCVVNDNGPAAATINNGVTAGFLLLGDAGGGLNVSNQTSSTFITPPGYKPMGQVSIWCVAPTYVAARGW